MVVIYLAGQTDSQMKIELNFPGKQLESAILRSVQPPKLRVTSCHGQSRFDGWRNFLILGENLPVLRWLRAEPDISGRVRLVYIDPPFSTNHSFKAGKARTATVSSSESDRAAYEDRLVGDEYLRFIRERLILLREILSKDGSLYVHIDWKMGHYVKILLDEVFGPAHFLNDIARIKCNPKNFARKSYGNVKDMILYYTKSNEYVWNDSRQTYSAAAIQRLFPKVDKQGRRYTTTPLHAPGETANGPTGKPWKGLTPPPGRHWRNAPDELSRLDKQGMIEWSRTGNPRKKVYADQIERRGRKRQDIWLFKDPPYPTYPTEKNLLMLKEIVRASSQEGDIVLDCFAGSGTTLVAAEISGRRWIGIDNSPIAIETAKERLLDLKNVSEFCILRQGRVQRGSQK